LTCTFFGFAVSLEHVSCRSRAPDRPWQYAALTWQLHRHASPEQIAAFILRCHEWRQQQQQCSPSSIIAAVAAAVPAARAALQPLNACEGHHSLFPDCTPLPSAVRQAQQLLRKGRSLDALYKLCPFAGLLLHVYAGKCFKHLLQLPVAPALLLHATSCSYVAVRLDVAGSIQARKACSAKAFADCTAGAAAVTPATVLLSMQPPRTTPHYCSSCWRTPCQNMSPSLAAMSEHEQTP
jgi:hypothetical protein